MKLLDENTFLKDEVFKYRELLDKFEIDANEIQKKSSAIKVIKDFKNLEKFDVERQFELLTQQENDCINYLCNLFDEAPDTIHEGLRNFFLHNEIVEVKLKKLIRH